MKKTSLLALAACAAVLAGCSKAEQKPAVELPDLACSFLSQTYGDQKVESVDNDSAAVYRAVLADKTVVEFNSDGMWQDVKCAEGSDVSMKVLPEMAAAYLQEIYPGKTVKHVERDINSGLMRVTLSDGLEIVFTSDGQVV